MQSVDCGLRLIYIYIYFLGKKFVDAGEEERKERKEKTPTNDACSRNTDCHFVLLANNVRRDQSWSTRNFIESDEFSNWVQRFFICSLQRYASILVRKSTVDIYIYIYNG